MENNSNKKETQMGEQNPTVDAPGSKVSDYGNVEGGTGTEDERTQRTTDQADRQNVEPLKDREDTMGNP